MRVAVLGAGGTIAPAIVRDLAESAEVDSLSLLDLDAERAGAVAEVHGQGKASAAQVDARADGALAGALADADVLVNSASYQVNLAAMRACLDAGCHYVDLGGLYHVSAEQLGLHDEFESAGLLALLGIGSAPGKTNLMGVIAKRELGDVTSMHVSAAGRDLDPPEGFSVPYALRTILDELTMPPVVVREGEPVEVDPLDPGGEVDFGDPIGPADTIHTLHTETLTFSTSFGCPEVSFRLSLPPGVVDRVRELAGADEAAIDRAAREAAAPSPHTVAVHLVDAAGAGRAVRVRAVTEPIAGWGIGGGVVSTASPAAAAVRLLARGEIEARGALPPERCLEPEPMFAELESRGCRVEIASPEVTA
jgi:saccharopine dehydrogenase-like NADP-dependent oxidoreductase